MKLRKLILCIVCLLFILALAACAVQSPSDTEGFTVQDTKKTDITFNWNAKLIPVTMDSKTVMPKIQRLTYDSCKSLIDNALQQHGICDKFKCSLPEGQSECKSIQKLKQLSYPEEFFQKNTLLLINFGISAEPFEVSDVSCDGDVLTCTVVYYGNPPGSVSNAGGHSWSVFVELDTVLPEEIQLVEKTNTVVLEDGERTEKSNAFYKEHFE